MSVSITIRNIPDETRDTLARRAADSGRSLQEYLSGELRRMAAEPRPEDWLARAEKFSQSVSPESGHRILDDLRADRR